MNRSSYPRIKRRRRNRSENERKGEGFVGRRNEASLNDRRAMERRKDSAIPQQRAIDIYDDLSGDGLRCVSSRSDPGLSIVLGPLISTVDFDRAVSISSRSGL